MIFRYAYIFLHLGTFSFTLSILYNTFLTGLTNKRSESCINKVQVIYIVKENSGTGSLFYDIEIIVYKRNYLKIYLKFCMEDARNRVNGTKFFFRAKLTVQAGSVAIKAKNSLRNWFWYVICKRLFCLTGSCTRCKFFPNLGSVHDENAFAKLWQYLFFFLIWIRWMIYFVFVKQGWYKWTVWYSI